MDNKAEREVLLARRKVLEGEILQLKIKWTQVKNIPTQIRELENMIASIDKKLLIL